MPDAFLRYTLDRDLLENLYLVLISGSEQPEHLEIVMWLSNPIEDDLAPEELYEDCYFLKIHKDNVDKIVRFAQGAHLKGNWEGPSLSALIRSSLVPGRMRRR